MCLCVLLTWFVALPLNFVLNTFITRTNLVGDNLRSVVGGGWSGMVSVTVISGRLSAFTSDFI